MKNTIHSSGLRNISLVQCVIYSRMLFVLFAEKEISSFGNSLKSCIVLRCVCKEKQSKAIYCPRNVLALFLFCQLFLKITLFGSNNVSFL